MTETDSKSKMTSHLSKDTVNKMYIINNSRNSRAARWLRNKWLTGVCKSCGVPDWKLEKYSATQFRRHHGSSLFDKNKDSVNRTAQK
jgi:pyrrolysyl-tRNA synthetase-like protein